MKTVAVFNQKGGVGKTSLSFHLGWHLSEIGRRTLLVDLDPQGNLSSLFGVDGCNAADIFTKQPTESLNPVDVVRESVGGKRAFSIVSSNESLQPLEATTNGLAGLTKLRKALRSAMGRWDYVVVDCPPSLGGFSANAIVAADEVIIPCMVREFSIHGLEHVCEAIESTREEGLNPDVRILAIVLNQFKRDAKRKTVFERDIWSEMEGKYADIVLPSSIPASIKIEEAIYSKVPVWEYAQSARDESCQKAAKAYKAVAMDLLHRLETKKVEGEAA